MPKIGDRIKDIGYDIVGIVVGIVHVKTSSKMTAPKMFYHVDGEPADMFHIQWGEYCVGVGPHTP